MAHMTWEKSDLAEVPKHKYRNSERLKFLIGGMLIILAIAYLIISGTVSGAKYFMTVENLLNKSEFAGETVRISGAVLGETIEYDSENLIIDFTISHIPDEFDDLATTLHQSINDPNSARLQVHVENEVMPDLLQHEAQAILTGALGEDGVFYASELLLKCPSRYEEAVPNQSVAGTL